MEFFWLILEFLYFCQFLRVLLIWLNQGKNRNRIKNKNKNKNNSFNFRLIFLYSRPNIENLGFPLPLKICPTRCSVRRYCCFFKSNVFWDLERLQWESELDSAGKIRSHKKSFVAHLTKKNLKDSKRYTLSSYFPWDITSLSSWKIVRS